MNKKIFGAILLLVLGTAVTVGVWYFLPGFLDREQTATSDAAKTKGKIRVAMDNWIGYFPLCSPEMKSSLRRDGWLLSCENDNADYRSRMQRFKNEEIELAVATVDSFILNGADFNYPAVAVMVIDESKGGDAILARKEKAGNLDALKGKKDIRVAFTPNSPSHHLIKAASDHFNVPELHPKGVLKVETDGSEEAREKLLAGEVDVAVLWEPDVTRALADKRIVKILGTEDTERLIVDILLVGREFAKHNPGAVKRLLSTYFKVLKKYREDPSLLQKDIKEETKLSTINITSMLNGVYWVSFMENCEKWFGIAAPGDYSEDGIITTIESASKILINAGDFDKTPIPDNNPYRLTNSTFLEELFSTGMSGFTVPGANQGGSSRSLNALENRFAPLADKQWMTLKEKGTLKVDPINFQHGSTKLNTVSKRAIDNAVDKLKHYPNFRILVRGHTGTRGDKKLNLLLSQQRADAVKRYMSITYGIDDNRVHSVGFGGSRPLKKKSGESLRAYQYRLPRVELVLVREEI